MDTDLAFLNFSQFIDSRGQVFVHQVRVGVQRYRYGGVAHQTLDGLDVHPGADEVRRERMPEAVVRGFAVPDMP